MMFTIAHLLTLADTYGAARGVGRKRVSTLCLGQGGRLDQYAAGTHRAWPDTIEKAAFWFAAHWPAEAVWPEGVPRPAIEAILSAPLTPDAARDSGGGPPRPATSAAGPHPIGAPPELPRLAGVGARESAAAPVFFPSPSEAAE